MLLSCRKRALIDIPTAQKHQRHRHSSLDLLSRTDPPTVVCYSLLSSWSISPACISSDRAKKSSGTEHQPPAPQTFRVPPTSSCKQQQQQKSIVQPQEVNHLGTPQQASIVAQLNIQVRVYWLGMCYRRVRCKSDATLLVRVCTVQEDTAAERVER